MKCIVYVSNAQESFDEKKLHQLASDASQVNRRDGLTGYLFFQKNTFIQYLESEGDEVFDLMSKIATDKRHRILFQIEGEGLVQRRFPYWGMRYITPEEINEINLERLLADELSLANTIGEIDQMSQDRVWRLVDLIANSEINRR